MPHELPDLTTDSTETSQSPEEPQESPVPDDISVELVPVEEGPRAGREMYVFSYGSKKVEFYFFEHMGIIEADTYMENIEGAERIPGETIRILKKVDALCQEIANTQQIPVQYSYTTKNVKMMQWAMTTGNEIFHWDSYTDLTRFGDDMGKLISDYPFGAYKKYWPATPA